jgi:hypothetical protein
MQIVLYSTATASGTPWTILFVTVATALLAWAGIYFSSRLGLSKDKRLRKEELDRHARYLAIRVVFRLDPFISGCTDVVNDSGLDDREGITHPNADEPSITFPDDVDWKSIDANLMYCVLRFGQRRVHRPARREPADVVGFVVAVELFPLAIHVAALAVHARREHQQAAVWDHRKGWFGRADNLFVA